MSLIMISDLHRIEPRAEVFSLVLNIDGPVVPSQPGGHACVLTTDDAVFNVSKLDGEDHWVIDGQWTLTGLPIFLNGEGARYTRLRVIDSDEATEMLDAAVAGYERAAVAS